MLVQSKSPISPVVARIRLDERGNTVQALLPEKNETFRLLVRSLGYRWSGCEWQRPVDRLAGEPADRAAELCAALLSAGFVVDAPEEIVAKAQTGDWQPEHKRWVMERNGKFSLYWRGHVDENLFRWAMSLPNAKYDPDFKRVIVDPLYYEEVIGFSEEHDFRFAPDAENLLVRARQEYQRNLIPEPPPPAMPKKKRGKIHTCNPAQFADIPPRKLGALTTLLPHQTPAVEKLLPLRVGALFMDMGTGKSRCAIELAMRRQARTSRVIWFCPVSLKLTIAAEITKHTEGEQVYIFDDKTTGENIPEAFWYVVGIESMSASDRVVLAVDKLVDLDAFVIVDESSYIKGHASKRTMRITEIARRARYRLLLTGTPISQGVVDLYAQMRFLSPDILGYNSFYSFARRHLEYSEKHPGMIVGARRVDDLAEQIAPYVYQVTKEECYLDLPEKLYDTIYCDLTQDQARAYQQAKDEILFDLDLDDITSYTIFRLFTALQQIVSGHWNRESELLEYPHNRIEALQTAIAGIPESEKIIIWCKYVYSLRQIAAVLPEPALYYGELNEQQRQGELERFRKKTRFLVATQSTGGHGLTLNETHYHIFYENEFKYAHRIQAEDRSHRIGQTLPVTYIDIVSNSGIDQRIMDSLSRKEDVVRAFKKKLKGKGGSEWLANI